MDGEGNAMEHRIATLRVGSAGPRESGRDGGGGDGRPGAKRRRLTRVLLTGSPRVALAGPGLGRLDARGWERRGGEEALGRTLLDAAAEAGLAGAAVGIAGVAVAADAAARVARRDVHGRRPEAAAADRTGARAGRGDGGPGAEGDGAGDDRNGGEAPDAAVASAPHPRLRIVAPGEARAFLAPLPLALLPLPADLLETLDALGLERAGDLAALGRAEVEARLGPAGLRAHRLARGEDGRAFPLRPPDEAPRASVELEAGVRSTEPLLFSLRQLLHRVCRDLEEEGRCAARLRLRLEPEAGEARREEVAPARPTRREELLFDLCRAALERVAEDGRLPAPVTGLELAVEERAAADARQGDLFAGPFRDPGRAAAALSRLRARLGTEAVARPARRRDHRPETRNAWRPVAGDGGDEGGGPGAGGTRPPDVAGVLRLLPEPEAVRVSCREGRPVALRDGRGRHEVVVAEGPERISGDWWRAPYAREYWWAGTGDGELLWIFREHRGGAPPRWRLHGWWD